MDKKHLCVYVKSDSGLSISFARKLRSEKSGTFSKGILCLLPNFQTAGFGKSNLCSTQTITSNTEPKRSLSTQSPNNRSQRKDRTITINAQPNLSLQTHSPIYNCKRRAQRSLNAKPNDHYQRKTQRSLSTQSPNDHYQCRAQNDHYQRKAQTITINKMHKSITINAESKSITINVKLAKIKILQSINTGTLLCPTYPCRRLKYSTSNYIRSCMKLDTHNPSSNL
jgi:hypothetical protein